MLVRNTIANYLGQGYTVLIGIVVLPLYLRYLGPEEFGLIGFFTLFSSWLQMLTVGLAPTLARQVAVFRARGGLGSSEFGRILRSLELVILVIGLATALGVWLASGWISVHWLDTTYLDHDGVAWCITMMGWIAALRWGVSLYSSGMAGMEQQVWLNGFNVTAATFRFIGGLLLVAYIDADIRSYFAYQAILSVFELALIGAIFYKRQPAERGDPGLRFSPGALREVLPFTLATTYSALIWIFVTQFDKLLLSNVLPLEQFGYLSFVVLLSNGVMRIADPINQAVLPRLTSLVARSEVEAVHGLYRRLTQFLAVIALPASAIIAVFAPQVLFMLSGNRALTDYGAEVLFWFALGNGVLVISATLFTLQAAHGQLRLHVANSTLGAIIQVPLMAYVALFHDVVTLGMAWFALRLALFSVISPIVHKRFGQGSYLAWVLFDIGLPAVGCMTGLTIALALDHFVVGSAEIQHRGLLLLILALYGCAVMGCAALGSRAIRSFLHVRLKHLAHL